MIEFACPACGKKYKVDDQLAGKRARCKGCDGVLVVPIARTNTPAELPHEPATPSAPSPVKSVKPSETAAPAPAECPSCGAAMAPAAVLCIECGYDKRTGKRLAGL